MNKTLPPLLTADDVAPIIKISVATLKKNVSFNPDSIPPFLKLGSSTNSPVRWRLADVESWLEAQFNLNNPCNHQGGNMN